jgi:lipase
VSPLHTHAFGPVAGPPVLALHGVTGHGRRYRRLAEEGLPEMRVIAPDLRGHGRSTWEPPWNVEALVADLLDTMDAANVERAAVVGHSYGGLLGMHLAAHAPARVERLVLIDPAVGLPPADMLEAAESTRRDEGWETEAEAHADRMSFRPASGEWAVAEELAEALELGDDGRYRLRYCRSAAVCAWGEMARPPASLRSYTGEVLLVPALQGDYVGDSLRAALRADLGARLTERGIDSSHMIYWDAFEELVSVIRPFLLHPT